MLVNVSIPIIQIMTFYLIVIWSNVHWASQWFSRLDVVVEQYHYIDSVLLIWLLSQPNLNADATIVHIMDMQEHIAVIVV
jgi:hypothetical protein